MNDNFYRAFEDRHRGSRELIKQRLQVYLPFVTPLLAEYPEGQTVDVGCGRGEWLEVLTLSGFKPVGLDTDQGMLQSCSAMELNAIQGDGLEYLKKVADDSQVIVSAFHVVEHISFDQLRELLEQAMRVLKPGGLLIMETPNTENIAVATRHFYLDPTHLRPIPSALLEFATEYAGFERVKVLRLQESKHIASRDNINLTDVLNGASPDYAVVAQKNADKHILELTEGMFNKEYGLSVDVLVARFDARLQSFFDMAEQAEATSRQSLVQLDAIYNSTSWRVTGPLRWLGKQRTLLQQRGVKQRSKDFVKKTLRCTLVELNKSPKLKNLIILVARKTRLEPQLKRLLARVRTEHLHYHASMSPPPPQCLESLSPRAQQIYTDLKAAIEQHGDKH